MLTASKIISLINNLNWKNEDHAKSKIFLKDIVYKCSWSKYGPIRNYALGRELEYSFFNSPKMNVPNDPKLVTNLDLYTTDATIDFISLFFNYETENLKNKTLLEIDVVVYLKNGKHTRMPVITKGKNQILECILVKMEQEKVKNQKRESVKNSKVKKQVMMALTNMA